MYVIKILVSYIQMALALSNHGASQQHHNSITTAHTDITCTITNIASVWPDVFTKFISALAFFNFDVIPWQLLG